MNGRSRKRVQKIADPRRWEARMDDALKRRKRARRQARRSRVMRMGVATNAQIKVTDIVKSLTGCPGRVSSCSLRFGIPSTSLCRVLN